MKNRKEKRKLWRCPKCRKRFYFTRTAARHAETKKHWGSYAP